MRNEFINKSKKFGDCLPITVNYKKIKKIAKYALPIETKVSAG